MNRVRTIDLYFGGAKIPFKVIRKKVNDLEIYINDQLLAKIYKEDGIVICEYNEVKHMVGTITSAKLKVLELMGGDFKKNSNKIHNFTIASKVRY